MSPAPAPRNEREPPELLESLGIRVLVRGWLSANNVVLIDTNTKSAVVVDTGYATHAAQTIQLIERALRGADLAAVVNTHLHSDHCGGNTTIKRRWPHSTLAVPAGYRDRVQPWDEDRLSFRDTDQACEPFAPDRFIVPGRAERLGGRSWEVHPAPGHDPDALVFFEPESRTLISGDALWESRLAIVFPELGGTGGFDAVDRTLDAIERLAPRRVIPGHGDPFTDVAAALRASRQRLDLFVRQPDRHRQYAVRALVSYHMLERRSRRHDELIDWMLQTPIFLRALRGEQDGDLARQVARDVVARLIADGSLVAQGQRLTIQGDRRAD